MYEFEYWQPGWYEHADGLWYPYPPYPGYMYPPGEYVDICSDDWPGPPLGGSSGGGGSAMPLSLAAASGGGSGSASGPGYEIPYDPCASVVEEPDDPPVDEPDKPGKPEKPGKPDKPKKPGKPKYPYNPIIYRPSKVVVAAEKPQPIAQGERGVGARTGEHVPVWIAGAGLVLAIGSGASLWKRREGVE